MKKLTLLLSVLMITGSAAFAHDGKNCSKKHGECSKKEAKAGCTDKKGSCCQKKGTETAKK